MKKFFSADPIVQNTGIGLIRIIIGIFLIYHGSEVFDAAKMKEYATWDLFKKNASPSLMPYLGKIAEFVGGILFVAGLFTRVASILITGAMLFIAFIIGNGKIFYEDQYPFLFAMLALVFIFTGPGNFSIDKMRRNKN